MTRFVVCFAPSVHDILLNVIGLPLLDLRSGAKHKNTSAVAVDGQCGP